jgi:hypothetical protein
MNDELVSRMRDRAARVRRIASMAHDPEMVAMLLQLAAEGDAEIAKLEAEQDQPITIEIMPRKED